MNKVPVVPLSALGGNTKPPKQSSPKKNYCMTLNNWTEEELNEILIYFKSDSANEYIIGKEKGELGTPHLQIYISFNIKKRFEQIKKINSRLHIEVSKGNRKQNLEYCSKEGDYITNCKLPRPKKKLACEGNLYDWQKKLCDICEVPCDDRFIYWIWSEKGGTGKTTFCKYLHRTYGAICLGGKSADMKHAIVQYEDKHGFPPDFLIVNIPRSFDSQYFNYTGFEECKDMFFHSGKYEGAMVDHNEPHMFIFANEEPNYDEMSPDRWQVINID